MIIEYTTVEYGVKTPSRSNPSDAGLDIYAYLKQEVEIAPGKNRMIPTGLRFGIPHGYMLQVCNRSSMGAKRSLIVGAHIIDSGYDGEVFIDLHNIGNESQIIYHEDKIAQLVLVPVVHFRSRQAVGQNLYENQGLTISNRGSDALGSTNEETSESHPLTNISGF